MARLSTTILPVLGLTLGLTLACSAGGGSGGSGDGGKSGNSAGGDAGGAGASGSGGLGTAGAAGGGVVEPPTTVTETYETTCEDQACTDDETCLDPGDGNTYCSHPCPGNVCVLGSGDVVYCNREGTAICSDK